MAWRTCTSLNGSTSTRIGHGDEPVALLTIFSLDSCARARADGALGTMSRLAASSEFRRAGSAVKLLSMMSSAKR